MQFAVRIFITYLFAAWVHVKPKISDRTIQKFTLILIPIKCSISIPILDSSYNISCGG